eukprot:4022939-Prymnesium_polylepis.1
MVTSSVKAVGDPRSLSAVKIGLSRATTSSAPCSKSTSAPSTSKWAKARCSPPHSVANRSSS